jgi:hypothetical protein
VNDGVSLRRHAETRMARGERCRTAVRCGPTMAPCSIFGGVNGWWLLWLRWWS